MKRLILILLLASLPMLANTLNWSITGSGINGSGTLTTISQW